MHPDERRLRLDVFWQRRLIVLVKDRRPADVYVYFDGPGPRLRFAVERFHKHETGVGRAVGSAPVAISQQERIGVGDAPVPGRRRQAPRVVGYRMRRPTAANSRTSTTSGRSNAACGKHGMLSLSSMIAAGSAHSALNSTRVADLMTPVTLSMKNSLFSGTVSGSRRSAAWS